MNPIDLNDLEKGVQQYMTAARFVHAQSVCRTAAGLSRAYGYDESRAQVAALLHDIARDLPLEEMKRILQNAGADFDGIDEMSVTPSLLHARAGAVVACKRFGIEDDDILRSIELHTTGGKSMSLLEKIVFVADFIEPGRTFRGVQTARKTAFKNIDKTMYYILRFLLRHLVFKKKYICENTVFAYNEYAMKFGDNVNNEN